MGGLLKPLLKTARTATRIVAASDADEKSKAGADYVCDGVDDQVEIQAAINALPSAGGKVSITAGNYKLYSWINLVKNDVTVMGEGGGTNLIATFPDGDVLAVGDGIVTTARVSLRDLRFSTNVTRTSGSYVKFNKCFQVSLTHFYMENAYCAIYLLSTTEAYIGIADIRNTGRDAIMVEGGGDHHLFRMVLDNPDIVNEGTGVCWLDGETLIIADIDVINFQNGLLIDPEAGKRTRWGFFKGAILDTNKDNGLSILADGGTVSGLNFTGCWTSSNTSCGILLDISPNGGVVEGISLINHISLRNGLAGLRIANSAIRDVNITGSYIISNSQTTAGDRHGIEIVAGVRNFLINNTIAKNGWAQGNTQNYGLGFDAGDTGDFVIANCDFTNNLNGAIINLNQLTGPNRVVKNVVGFLNENSGAETFSGDGVATAFSFAHGLFDIPTHVEISPKSTDAAGDYYWSADATNITVTFPTAPAAGTNNVVFSWRAKV